MTRLTKDGAVWEINDAIQVQAFLNSGWVIDKSPKKATKPVEEPVPTPAAEEPKKAGRPPKK